MLNSNYETGSDLHVATYTAYLHTDKKLYTDAAHKTPAKKSEIEHAFMLGRLAPPLRPAGGQETRADFSDPKVSCD